MGEVVSHCRGFLEGGWESGTGADEVQAPWANQVEAETAPWAQAVRQPVPPEAAWKSAANPAHSSANHVHALQVTACSWSASLSKLRAQLS